MAQEVNLTKEVFGRTTYTKVIDISFTELYTPVTASIAPSNQTTVELFFDAYNDLFFQIPATGELNSHEYLVKRSLEYLGGGVVTDTEQAYIDEINSLRQQLLEANTNFLNINNLV
jgi:hypothetical protein